MTATAQPDCDRGLTAASPPTIAPGHPALLIATCVLASSLAFIDGSVVNVGLPAIGKSLHASGAGLQWLINAYLLPLSSLLLFGGAAGDRFGRRRLLIVGVSLFALASLVCMASPGLSVLLVGRFLQGVGAALLMPSSLAILGGSFSGADKGRAIGIWAASGAAMGALGPALGGWLIDSVGWRAIFVMNLPLALGAIGLAWRVVPLDRSAPDHSLDSLGAMLATVGLGLATWALTIGSGAGWTNGAIAIGLAALAIIGWFVLVEYRRRDRAMMPLALFGSRTFVGLTVLTVMLYGAFGGLFLLVPFLLIQSGHFSATAAGAALIPLPLVLAIGSPAMGALAGRIGPRLPLTIGPCVVACGFALMLRIDGEVRYVGDVLPALLVVSLGMSGAVAPLTTAVLSSVDDRHTGSASGFNSAVARTGGLIATALVGPVLTARGPALVANFHVAALTGAALCVASAAAAYLLVGADQANGRSP